MFPVNVKKGLISIVFYYSDGFFNETRERERERVKRGRKKAHTKKYKNVIRLPSKLVKIEDDFYV